MRNRGTPLSLLFGALASRFFHPRSYGPKALVLKHYAEKVRVPTGYGRECTPAINGIQLLCVAEFRQEIPEVWRGRNSTLSKSRIYLLLSRHVGCSLIKRSM